MFLLVVVLYTSIPAWRNVETETKAEDYFEGDLVRKNKKTVPHLVVLPANRCGTPTLL